MAAGSLPPAAGGMSVLATFIYDNLDAGDSQLDHPYTDEAVDLSQPEINTAWTNEDGLWVEESPRLLTLSAGFWTVELNLKWSIAASTLGLAYIARGALESERLIPHQPSLTHLTLNACFYAGDDETLALEMWPDDDESTLFLHMFLRVRKIG